MSSFRSSNDNYTNTSSITVPVSTSLFGVRGITSTTTPTSTFGTGTPPFENVREVDGTIPGAPPTYFATITAMPQYGNKSVEELRMEDLKKKHDLTRSSSELNTGNNGNATPTPSTSSPSSFGKSNRTSTVSSSNPNYASSSSAPSSNAGVSSPNSDNSHPTSLSLLSMAVWNNYLDTVKVLIENLKVPINYTENCSPTPSKVITFSPFLLIAALQGNEEMTNYLLQKGAAIDGAVPERYLLPIVEYIPLRVTNGTDTFSSITPLVGALYARNANIVASLLNAGASRSSISVHNVSNPLTIACNLGSKNIVRLLLNRYNYSVHGETTNGGPTTTPLSENSTMYSTSTNVDLAANNIRLTLPSFVPKIASISPLWHACMPDPLFSIPGSTTGTHRTETYSGECIKAKYVFDEGTLRSERYELIQELLRRGADPNIRNGDNLPLLFCCTDVQIRQLLIQYRANVELEVQEWNFLHYISSQKSINLSFILLMLEKITNPHELGPDNHHFILRLWYTWLIKLVGMEQRGRSTVAVETLVNEWQIFQKILIRIGIEDHPNLLNEMVSIVFTAPFTVDGRILLPEIFYILGTLFRSSQFCNTNYLAECLRRFPHQQTFLHRYQALIAYDTEHPLMPTVVPIVPNSNYCLPLTNTPLIFLSLRQPFLLEMLLNSGANSRCASVFGRTPLIEAILAGKDRRSESIDDVNSLTNGSTTDNENIQPRYESERIKDCVVQLLNNGVDVDQCDNFGNTALHYCAAVGQIEVMDLLLQRGANIHRRSYTNVGVVEALFTVKLKDNHHDRTKDGIPFCLGLADPRVHQSLTKPNYTSVYRDDSENVPFTGVPWNLERLTRAIDLVLRYGASLRTTFSHNTVPLFKLIIHSLGLSPEIIDMLINKGMECNVTDPRNGQTLLMVTNISSEMLKVLVSKMGTTQINIRDHRGRTALFYASKCIANERIRILTDANADATIVDEDNVSPLLVYLLSFQDGLRTGIFPSGRNDWYIEARRPYYDAIKLLCRQGAIINLPPDNWGRTILGTVEALKSIFPMLRNVLDDKGTFRKEEEKRNTVVTVNMNNNPSYASIGERNKDTSGTVVRQGSNNNSNVSSSSVSEKLSSVSGTSSTSIVTGSDIQNTYTTPRLEEKEEEEEDDDDDI